jgi:hypothetical protein
MIKYIADADDVESKSKSLVILDEGEEGEGHWQFFALWIKNILVGNIITSMGVLNVGKQHCI